MAKLLDSGQMRAADRRTMEELGLPGVVLMENAGAGVVSLLQQRLPDWRKQTVLVLTGQGNNGGDGFVVARRLLQAGVAVSVFMLGRCDGLRGDALTHFRVFEGCGGLVRERSIAADWQQFDRLLEEADVVVDAVFGTGLTRPVEERMAHLFGLVNRSGKPVLAVDLPSGVSADTGQILGVALQARWTVTFAAEKIGHRTYPGAAWCGEVVVVPIGIPDRFIQIPEHAIARNLPADLAIPLRQADGHKGSFGHLLIWAGSVGKEGAAVLTALGALRTGPGLVTVATPQAARSGVVAKVTEAMTLPLPDDGTEASVLAALHASAVQPDALAIGPGLGRDAWLDGALIELLQQWDVPTVLDADGLNLVARRRHVIAKLSQGRHAPLILTPHPGEFSRLLAGAVSAAAIQADRLHYARQVAQAWQVWLVLKGAGTVIAAPDGRAWINDTGNTGLAAGGSGDLLTGVIAGLLTQGWSAESAVRAGVWLHGRAADLVAQEGGEAGLLASDLLPHVRRLRNSLSSDTPH
ncbi:MAG: NAD(P)H-hydrate dehydratase [Magnetococcales bacterium]|nr:NAD(P)H-hydrate dehydratase [Magnetococcales bacterium]